jgi:hypothetical protein
MRQPNLGSSGKCVREGLGSAKKVQVESCQPVSYSMPLASPQAINIKALAMKVAQSSLLSLRRNITFAVAVAIAGMSRFEAVMFGSSGRFPSGIARFG